MHLGQAANLAVPLEVCIPAVAVQVVVEMKLKLKTHHLHIHQNHLVVSFSDSLLKIFNVYCKIKNKWKLTELIGTGFFCPVGAVFQSESKLPF